MVYTYIRDMRNIILNHDIRPFRVGLSTFPNLRPLGAFVFLDDICRREPRLNIGGSGTGC